MRLSATHDLYQKATTTALAVPEGAEERLERKSMVVNPKFYHTATDYFNFHLLYEATLSFLNN